MQGHVRLKKKVFHLERHVLVNRVKRAPYKGTCIYTCDYYYHNTQRKTNKEKDTETQKQPG